jgi:hypothetical protein
VFSEISQTQKNIAYFFSYMEPRFKGEKQDMKVERGWAWWWTPVIPTAQGVEKGRSRSEASPEKSTRPYLKSKLKPEGLKCGLKWVECLPSKCEALRSISSVSLKKKKVEGGLPAVGGTSRKKGK